MDCSAWRSLRISPTNPWVYVLYTFDAAIGGTAPRWGSVGGTSDDCPTPPGPTDDGCVVAGHLSRLQASGNTMIGSEQVLIEDWCQQYPSHSIGSLAFGADGALYVSGGDGASFNFVDYGQDGAPVNPCGDPPGGSMSPPTAEGGALRSQDVRTSGDPFSLDGAILRVDPATGAGLPGNPMASSSDLNARRIVAHGLRNPFRMTTRPGTNEVWIGDVGWNEWEEIDRLVSPTSASAANFGWPCYEGDGRQGGYDAANLNICENLYAAGSGAVVAPYFRYHHNDLVLPNDVCPKGGSSVAGTSFAFSSGGSYPAEYRGALFFADYTRRCIWAIPTGSDGLPDISKRKTFVGGAAQPVDLQIGPGGDLFYVDLGGTIRRVRYFNQNQPPIAVASRQPDERGRAVDRRVRRHRLERRRRRRADLRLGPGRRRRLRRRRRRHRQLHVHPAGHVHRHAPGHRPLRGDRHVTGHDLGGQHAADGGDRHAGCGYDLEGRGRDHLLRPRHRPRSRARCPLPRSHGRSCCSTARPPVTSTRSRRSQARRAAASSRPITSTRRTWSCG